MVSMPRFLSAFAVVLTASLFLPACAGSKTAQKADPDNPDGIGAPSSLVERGKRDGRKAGKDLDEKDQQVLEITFIEGVRARQLGNEELAVARFAEVLDMDPNNGPALYELARLAFEAGDVPGALPLAVKASELEPDNYYIVEMAADMLTLTGQFEAAAAACMRLTELRPNQPEPYFRLAYTQQQSGDLKGALDAYGEVETRFGPEPSLLLERHRIHLMEGNLDQAAEELERLVALFPDDPEHYEMLARVYESNNEPEKAAAVYDQLLSMEDDNPELLLRAASIYGMKKDYANYRQKAQDAFASEAVNIDAKVAFLVPWIDSLGTDFPTQEFVFDLNQRMVRAHPDDPKSHALYADFLYHSDRKEEARSNYLRSLENEKGIFDVWRQVFQIDLELGHEDSLAAITERAMDYYPNQPAVFYFNGYANLREDKAEAAVRSLKRALPMAIGNDPFRADIQSLLGDALHQLERHEESDEAYRASLAIEPDNAFVLNNFAYYLSLRGTGLEEAEKMAAHAVELEPENASFLDTYAWVLYNLAKYKQAREWQEKALAAGGENSSVQQEHYGDILFRLDLVDSAVSAWEKALELAGAKADNRAELQRKISERRLP